MRWRLLVPLVFLALLAGCTGARDYFPLEKNRSWTYSVNTGFSDYVVDVRVTGQVPVGNAMGYRMEGPLGVSRVAWNGDRLVTDCMPNTRIAPPLTILAPKAAVEIAASKDQDKAKEEAKRNSKAIYWQGFIETMGDTQPAKAKLTQEFAKLKIGTQTYDTILAILTIRSNGKVIELKTWYSPEIGPIQQAQHTAKGKEEAKLDVGMAYLGSR